jgi:hypothetical protein
MNYQDELSFSALGLAFPEPLPKQETQPDRKECIEKYMELTGKLQEPLEAIEKLLKEYYDENKYFPQKKASFLKWNLLRKRKSTMLEIYFEGTPQKKAADSSLNLPQIEPWPNKVPSPQVLTYAMVGAPPTGPKNPKYPG